MDDLPREVIVEAARGDMRAFEVIYRAYFGLVSATAWRMVSGKQDAEDVVQEVFMTLFRKLKDFQFRSSLKTWVYRITVNTAINHSRKVSKDRRRRVEYEVALTVPIKSQAARKLEVEEEGKRTREFLAGLNPDQRACIVLRSVEGLSYQEIAEALQVPINTVRSRIKRARQTLLALRREEMKNEL